MSWVIRRVRPDEGPQLRALRLHALRDAPWAFGSTLAREGTFTDTVWRERATRGAAGADVVTYVAEADDRWIGMATGLAADPNEPRIDLVGMFVEPAARGRGVGAALVEAVAGWARGRRAMRLHLWVTAANGPALALYRRCGFRPTGKTQPLDHAPSLLEVEMVRDL
jgi:GNAT superfamily N-acetyltransferase